MAEIAARLRVRPQTVHTWRQRGLMPEPRWTVSGQPAWDRSTSRRALDDRTPALAGGPCRLCSSSRVPVGSGISTSSGAPGCAPRDPRRYVGVDRALPRQWSPGSRHPATSSGATLTDRDHRARRHGAARSGCGGNGRTPGAVEVAGVTAALGARSGRLRGGRGALPVVPGAGRTVRRLIDCLIAAVAIQEGVERPPQGLHFEILARHTRLRVERLRVLRSVPPR